MAVFRVDKKIVAMPVYHLEDERLSLDAKGLLSIILAFPDLDELHSYTSDESNFIRAAFDELIGYGYIRCSGVDSPTMYDINEKGERDE